MSPRYLLALLCFLLVSCSSNDPLPSWNEGPAKKAIIDFVHETTRRDSQNYVPEEERIATFDQDGTLWVEQPLYTQLIYCLERLAIPIEHDELAKLTRENLKQIVIKALTGMSTGQFQDEVSRWLQTAKHPRWQRPYTDLTYKPMTELLEYLRTAGYRTYIVTGGGQDFVRVYSAKTYGIAPEAVVGSAAEVTYTHDAKGNPVLIKEPKLMLNDNFAGKPEGIHLFIGRRPSIAFGNSTGDEQMLEYTTAGKGARLGFLVLHDDPIREYAYGPAQGLPDSLIGTFTQELYDRAQEKGWVVISMKDDWNQIFSFQEKE